MRAHFPVAAVALMLYVAVNPVHADAERDYVRYCQQCHGPDGRGMVPRAPDFTRNEGLMKTDAQLARYLRDGSPGKPPLGNQLSNQELLDLVNYVRTAFR